MARSSPGAGVALASPHRAGRPLVCYRLIGLLERLYSASILAYNSYCKLHFPLDIFSCVVHYSICSHRKSRLAYLLAEEPALYLQSSHQGKRIPVVDPISRSSNGTLSKEAGDLLDVYVPHRTLGRFIARLIFEHSIK